MIHSKPHQPDSQFDLVLERVIDVPRDLVWTAWTQPEHVMKWFTPAPWKTVECEIDLRPGGVFRTVMQSPEGQKFPNLGCYLEVIPNEKLVWTNVLGPGFRPTEMTGSETCGHLLITAIITFENQGQGTKYTATALHANQAGCQKHAEMGFHEGWGTALNQLVEVVKGMGGRG